AGFSVSSRRVDFTITVDARATTITATLSLHDALPIFGADTVDGGAGTDTISLTATSATLNSATNAQIVNVEAVSAATAGAGVTIWDAHQTEGLTVADSGFGDTITGGSGNDTIMGFVGA